MPPIIFKGRLGFELSKFVLRDCRSDELDAVLALWHAADASISRTDTDEDLLQVMDDESAQVFVAEIEGEIIGSIIGTFDGWRGNIYRLAVHPRYQRRGIARALVSKAEDYMVGKGAQRITALVEKEHASAMGFWEGVDYEIDSRMVRFVKNI